MKLLSPLLLALSLTSCAQETAVRLRPLPSACGIMAVRDSHFPTGFNESPPACALPAKEEVAMWCSIHDRINAPGYWQLPRDEDDNVSNEPPLPKYNVSHLTCEFKGEKRNSAQCRFRLAVPGEAVASRKVEARFDHIYWRDDGPAHHLETTRWDLKDDCTPDDRTPP